MTDAGIHVSACCGLGWVSLVDTGTAYRDPCLKLLESVACKHLEYLAAWRCVSNQRMTTRRRTRTIGDMQAPPSRAEAMTAIEMLQGYSLMQNSLLTRKIVCAKWNWMIMLDRMCSFLVLLRVTLSIWRTNCTLLANLHCFCQLKSETTCNIPWIYHTNLFRP